MKDQQFAVDISKIEADEARKGLESTTAKKEKGPKVDKKKNAIQNRIDINQAQKDILIKELEAKREFVKNYKETSKAENYKYDINGNPYGNPVEEPLFKLKNTLFNDPLMPDSTFNLRLQSLLFLEKITPERISEIIGHDIVTAIENRQIKVLEEKARSKAEEDERKKLESEEKKKEAERKRVEEQEKKAAAAETRRAEEERTRREEQEGEKSEVQRSIKSELAGKPLEEVVSRRQLIEQQIAATLKIEEDLKLQAPSVVTPGMTAEAVQEDVKKVSEPSAVSQTPTQVSQTASTQEQVTPAKEQAVPVTQVSAVERERLLAKELLAKEPKADAGLKFLSKRRQSLPAIPGQKGTPTATPEATTPDTKPTDKRRKSI